MAIPSEPFDSRPVRAYFERGMRRTALEQAWHDEAASWPRVGERVSATDSDGTTAWGTLLETFPNGEGLVGWDRDSGTSRIPLGALSRVER